MKAFENVCIAVGATNLIGAGAIATIGAATYIDIKYNKGRIYDKFYNAICSDGGHHHSSHKHHHHHKRNSENTTQQTNA